jgi:hypothetical protein
MKKDAISVFSPFQTLRFPASGLALIFFLDGPPPPSSSAQTAKSSDPAQTREWAPAAIAHAQKMRKFRDADRGSQPTPAIIPRLSVHDDPSGKIATFQPDGPTFTALNPFFQNLGTNGRTFSAATSRKRAGPSARPAFRPGSMPAEAPIRSSA